MKTLRSVLAAALLLAAVPPLLTAGEPPAAAGGWVPLLNGKDLTGWKGDAALWTVEDGVLVGRCEGLKKSIEMTLGVHAIGCIALVIATVLR